MVEKKILIWCGPAANQRALANKIAARFNVCGIVTDKKRGIKKKALARRLLERATDQLFFRRINGAWKYIQDRYSSEYKEWPSTLLLSAESINSEEAYDFSKRLDPDLIIVSGTSLVKKKMLSLRPRIGIINLHTGLSPYVKGGPNCTNWCIANGEFEKIGNTIMWISEGIDSGNIITSECTAFSKFENLNEIQWQVMEHAHDLYLRTIEYLLKATPPYPAIPQNEIAEGKLFLTKMWGFRNKRKLLQNLSSFSSAVTPKGQLVTIPLPSQTLPG